MLDMILTDGGFLKHKPEWHYQSWLHVRAVVKVMPEPPEMLDNLLMNQTLYERWILVLMLFRKLLSTIQAQDFLFLPSMFYIVLFSFKYVTVYLQEMK